MGFSFSGRGRTVSGTLSLLVLAFALPAQAELLIDCDEGQLGGDAYDRGFYVPEFPGVTFDRVDLAFSSKAGGSFTVSLTARAGTYDGPLLGVSEATVTLSGGIDNNVVTSFLFPSPVVTEGSTVTFAIHPVAGGTDLYYAVGAFRECPIVQTEGTTPPLDVWRRDGIRIQIFGSRETPVEETTWGRVKTCYR